MDSKDIIKEVILLNKEYLFFKDAEGKLINRIAETLENFPQIVANSRVYTSFDLEVHTELKRLFEKYVTIHWHIDDENIPWLIFKSAEDKELGRIKIGDEHSFGRQIWEEDFHETIFLPSLEILIQNFFYLKNLDKMLTLRKGESGQQ